ncbi:Glyoxalase/bleomycin resistance protein/dioxygenase [Paraglaciecola sp. T6c]|uniref:VOC family protein n=1 Tax=Pseudoalteromonas atlantica (strain T6c / ATCC BAA-1087) TaxID=3042615 RepID=UPI00005C64CC|nr:VOC family protein [Paraglaciecola sp. T6c]ABG39958.1 Glyoxalase/bleomycin resistance protein/dioxygenase [Paraglaciecola sp. T6c]
MELGAFSISLSVKDIALSKIFYEKLGFAAVGGDQKKGWLILRNSGQTIGLFQGMFEKNTLTFNPGWDVHGNPTETFTDVRNIQQALKSKDIDFMSEVTENTVGPGSFMMTDPDGNPILVDQHR